MTVNPDKGGRFFDWTKSISQEEKEELSCKEGNHSFVSGMIYVHDDELDLIAEVRHIQGLPPVECERCEAKYIWDPDTRQGNAFTQFVNEFSANLEEGFNN